MQKDKKDISKENKTDLSNEIKLFGKSPSALYVLKKAERLVAALYLVSDLFPNDDPLRVSLRSRGLYVLSLIANQGRENGEQENMVSLVQDAIGEIVSMLNIATMMNNLSSMNYDVLEHEYCSLLEFILTKGSSFVPQGRSFDKDFFNVPNDFVSKTLDPWGTNLWRATKDKGQYKGQFEQRISISDNYALSSKGQPPNVTGGAHGSNGLIESEYRHTKRRSVILDVVNRRGRVSVKDISQYVKDCSSKTLQRELLSLVAEGVLKKEGERRWSTYTIV